MIFAAIIRHTFFVHISYNNPNSYDLLSIFPFPVCNSVTMDIDETSVNAVLSLLLAFIKHLLTRHLFYLRFGNSYTIGLLQFFCLGDRNVVANTKENGKS